MSLNEGMSRTGSNPVQPGDDVETTEVLICGCGPTGAMLSALLGRLGVQHVILDREDVITTDPRGIALDEDGIRILQSLGIYDAVYSEIGQCMGTFNFISGRHKDLSATPFMRIDYQTSEGGTGHVGFICHKQPTLESHLRRAISQHSCSDLRVSCTVNGISEDSDFVYTSYIDSHGRTKNIKSKFLVGADGKTGYTRKMYLERRGIELSQISRTTYEETWVALNWKISLPTPETHPLFPLWALGYTPQDVYDLFFPANFRFLCNPERPSVCGRFGLPEDRLWRFEFVVKKGEDGMDMSSAAKIRDVVYPYITHPGKRYGLPGKVQYPTDCIETLRSRPFKFSARSCNKWALDRVILCGDAAHVFPPFGGQGIASGFRDASSLAWRLAIACSPQCTNYSGLFTAWYQERKQQLDRSLNSTIENGAYVTESNQVNIFLRDWYLWGIQLVPSWKRGLEMGPRRLGMTAYNYEPGMAFLPDLGGGGCFPQVYCAPLGAEKGFQAKVAFTDDILFSAEKTGLFQIAVLLDQLEELESAEQALCNVEKLSQSYILASEATFIVQDSSPPLSGGSVLLSSKRPVVRLATALEFAADERLCGGRPPPQHYDEYRMSKEVRGRKYVILRPDRFVFAACANQQELEDAARRILDVIYCKS